ncbi:MAG: histidinol dehydrogenase [Cycloclasticus sp. Phe_18]|jgi:histidinol dehydrogenase|nr:MAG: histidinol dehydrogenase [Cycloclasticus sp. Phe_18]MDF1689829.1 histidinol dehydrogenase [Cycloclasticus sp.]
MNIKTLDAADNDFGQALSDLLAWDTIEDASINQAVLDIIEAVRQQGDNALLAYTQEFDQWPPTVSDLIVGRQQLEAAWNNLNKEQSAALTTAADRIRDYAEYQKMQSWDFVDEFGNTLGQKITAVERVGVYVPGGKAAYPSSVLMNVIPAKVAGVAEIVMVTPTPKGELNQLVLAAAWLAGVDKVIRIGGAQAVAALAYGTKTVPAVDKIVGPGNIFVATAKKMVFGQVGIDMVAGPSEILIVCDGKTNPDWIAMDLFSQAEHDENAQSILISLDADFIDAVKRSMSNLLPTMERTDVIEASLESRGGFIYAQTNEQAIEIINKIAPEHLELSVENAEEWVDEIKHAGAIFMGRYTPEALGDYCAGPNHVLPTSGTARFSSPLGVYDFQKRTSIINCSQSGASELVDTASILARGEALTAHAKSAEYRKLTH